MAAAVLVAAARRGAGSVSLLSAEEKAALIARIKHAESRTMGEIVTVIAQQSDDYRYIPILWAALLALSVPGVYYAWMFYHSGGWNVEQDTNTIVKGLYATQVLIFLGFGMLFQLPAVRLWFIPASVKQRSAARHAREQFFLQKLHLTEGRTGVLIFVSVAEHYVEIIVDSGIAEIIDNTLWDDVVKDFISLIRKGKIAAGFERTIDRCREVLWQHFPATDSYNPDELPNHLIEV